MNQRYGLRNWATIMLGLLVVLVAWPAAHAQRIRGVYRDTKQLPGGAIGERVQGLIGAINSNNEATMRAFMKDHFASAFQNENAMGQQVDLFKQVFQGSNGFEFFGIRRFEMVRPANEVIVVVQNKMTRGWQALMLNLEQGPPHKIQSVRFAPAKAPTPETTASGSSQDQMVAELEKFVSKLAKADRFSGTVLLAKDGEVLFKSAFGLASKRFNVPNKVDTKFNLGSMNKMFTGVAIAQLVQRGVVSLDDPLSKFASTDWLARDVADKIKIRHLLTHTSGLGSYFNRTYMETSKTLFRELDDYKPLIVGSELAFEPGTQWQYSNTGLFMLGVVIEKATGQDYFDYIRENVYKPAGMINSDCYDMDRPIPNLAIGYSRTNTGDGGPPWTNNYYKHVIRGGPAGGGFSTVEDLLRFDVALRAHKLLDETHTEMLWKPRPEWNSRDYGFGFGLKGQAGDRNVGHSGGFDGISSNLDMFLDSGYTAIVMSNYDGGSRDVSDKMRRLISMYK